jgi:hypothetical protein
MRDKIGKLNAGMVWLFALGAILLAMGGAWATADLGTKVSSAVYFGVFAVCGFLGMFLTRSRTFVGVAAFFVAAAASGVIYYLLVSQVFAEATTTLATASGGEEGQAQAAGMALGSAVGLFAAGLTFLASLVAGIGGCVAGAKQRKKFAAA